MFLRKYHISVVFTLVLTLLSSAATFAQYGTIRGFVYEKATGEPVIFTNVVLRGTVIGATTDVNGYYYISKIVPGTYTLEVTYIGFDPISIPVTINANEILNKKLYITKKSKDLGAVEISAEKEEMKKDVRISVTKITPKEIKQIPSVGGDADLAQYLQVLPGAVFTGDQGGQLYIRGGAPIQNKVLMDGMIIYNPFHSIGFFSVFDTDILRNVDVYTGGFNAEYGGRISSIMDLTTRDGNKKRFSGKISTSPFTSKALFEGPLSKAKTEGGGTSSFILSAKTSYLDKSSKLFYGYVDSLGLPYNFNDIYGKISLNASNGNKVNIFGFNFTDKVNYQHVSNLNWKSSGFGSNFVVIPGVSTVLINGNFAYSSYDISLAEAEKRPRDSKINGFNMGLDFTYFPSRDDELKYGIEVLGYSTDFNFYNDYGRHIQQTENTTELAGFMKYKKVIKGKFIFEPSFRANYYASLAEFSPEPRLGLKYNVTDRFRLKFAGGYYSQNLISANSDMDVVNLFYGFLSGSDNLPTDFNGKTITSHLQRARHEILGFEYDIFKHWNLNIEGYQKDFLQLTNLNRDKLFEDTGENSARPDNLKKDYIIETGYARGIDFMLKYDYKRLYIWAVYSLGYVSRTDGIRTYSPHFDRRHNMNFVGSYTFGKTLLWEADVRWNFGSGFPFTPTAGFYEYQNFTGGLNANYTSNNGTLGTLLGDINSSRLSDYHRLDVTVKRKFDLSDHSQLEAFVNVVNLYNQRNVFYTNRVTGQTIYQFPILPSAGFSLTF